MIVMNWGKNYVQITDNIVMQYNYFGLFFFFLISFGGKYYEVLDQENMIVRELTREEIGINKPWSYVPFMHRFGLLILIAVICCFSVCS